MPALRVSRRASSPSARNVSATMLRLEAFAASKPKRRVLVSIQPGSTLDALCNAVALRLGMDSVPARALYLGHTEAAIVAVDDLRDGDVLRVEDDGYPSGSGGEGQGSEKDSSLDGLHTIVRLLLTVVIFVIFFEGFQRWVFRPIFRPDLASAQSAAQIAAAQPTAQTVSIM